MSRSSPEIDQRQRNELTRVLDLLNTEGPGEARVALEALRHAPDLAPEILSEIRLALADAYEELGVAKPFHQEVSAFDSTDTSDLEQTRAQVRKGRSLYLEAQTRDAAEVLEEAVRALLPTKEHRDLASAYLWLADARWDLDEVALARQAYEDALATARRCDARSVQARSLVALGRLEISSGTLSRAASFLERACEILRGREHRARLQGALFSLAVCETHRGHWDTATKLLDESEQVCRELDDSHFLGRGHIQRARLLRRQGSDPSTALDEADALARSMKFPLLERMCLLERALWATKQESWDTARKALADLIRAEAKLPPREQPDPDVFTDTWLALAEVELAASNQSAAEKAVEQAASRASSHEDRIALSKGERLRAHAALLANDLPSARESISKSIATLDEMGASYELYLSHRLAQKCWGRGAREFGLHRLEASRLEDLLGLGAQPDTIEDLRHQTVDPGLVGPEIRHLLESNEALLRLESSITVQGEHGIDLLAVARAAFEMGSLHDRRLQVFDLIAHSADELGERLRRFEAPSTSASDELDCLILRHLDHADLEAQRVLLRVLSACAERSRVIDGVARSPLHIIATTNTPLVNLVADGTLLDSVYDAVGTLTIAVPRLTDRPRDIRAAVLEKLPHPIPSDVTNAFLAYEWPGNDYELRNTLRAAAVEATGRSLEFDFLPEALRNAASARTSLPDQISELERREIVSALTKFDGNKKRASEYLGVSRKGLIDRLKRLDLWDRYKAG